MAGMIFYKQRHKVGTGEKKPRFRVVGVAGCDLRLYARHMPYSELQAIATRTGAELVLLPAGGEQETDKGDV